MTDLRPGRTRPGHHHRAAEALDAFAGPRVGDWVDFADGVSRRISYIGETDTEPSMGESPDQRGGTTT